VLRASDAQQSLIVASYLTPPTFGFLNTRGFDPPRVFGSTLPQAGGWSHRLCEGRWRVYLVSGQNAKPSGQNAIGLWS
jgi:hypothetical protein